MKEQLETVKTLLICACLLGCCVNSCKQKATSADLWALQNMVYRTNDRLEKTESKVQSVFTLEKQRNFND